MNLGQSMRYVNVVLSVVNQWIDGTQIEVSKNIWYE